MHSASYQTEYQSALSTPGHLGKVKSVERGTDHSTALRTVGRDVERYLHIPMRRSRSVRIEQGIALSLTLLILVTEKQTGKSESFPDISMKFATIAHKTHFRHCENNFAKQNFTPLLVVQTEKLSRSRSRDATIFYRHNTAFTKRPRTMEKD